MYIFSNLVSCSVCSPFVHLLLLPQLTPTLLMSVLGAVLGGDHLPLQDAAAHEGLPLLVPGSRVVLVPHHLGNGSGAAAT